MAASGERDAAIASLFDPRTVAVVGASRDPAKWGYMVSEKVLAGRHRRDVYLVNRAGDEILGHASVRSVSELPAVPDLAIVTVPEAAFGETIKELAEAGTRSIVAITAGFGETGESGRVRQAAAVEIVRRHGGVLLGPNCLGVFNAAAEFNCMAWAQPAPGHIGVISQSGSVIMDLAERFEGAGLGISRAASIGNQADVTVGELARGYAKDDRTRVIVIYIEDTMDGRALFTDIAAATAAGTSVVVLAPNSVAAVARAARSHTGALISDRALLAEASQAAGAVLTTGLAEAAEAAQALLSPVRASGNRAVVVTDAGGFGVLGAGECARAGLELPTLSEETQAKVAEFLLPGAGISNPVDLVGVMDVGEVPAILRLILETDEVDCALLNISAFVYESSEKEAVVGEELASLARDTEKPVVLATIDIAAPGPRAASAAGVAVFRDMRPAAAALATLARVDEAGRTGPPRIPPAATRLDLDPLDYLGARAALESAGVPFPPARLVDAPETAGDQAEELGFPVVLKALGLLHKSDAGGVALNLRDRVEVARAAEAMGARVGAVQFSVEAMVTHDDATELIVGGKSDPRFGPTILLGMGGIYAEILDDSVVLLAPFGEADVERALRQLRGSPLLFGARGRPAVDIAALTRTVKTVGDFLAEHPEIDELDVNPLLTGPYGVTALDARILVERA